MTKQKVIALVGPTCTGKTALAIHLAKEFSAEIIACDSRTVYKYFDIGTAKPTAEEQAAARHHLIDVAEPEESFSAARFFDEATRCINEIEQRGKSVIICGGTGLYLRTLLEGFAMPKVGPQEELRLELNEFADQNGNAALVERLAQIDPQSAAKLNVNDRFRLIRALEVSITTGLSFSSLAQKEEPNYDTLWLGLTFADRQKHRDWMKLRIAAQMDAGMLEETKKLYERFGPSQRLLSTVNYSDLVEHIEGRLNLKQALEACQIHNFQLARRQRMWFKRNPLINWLPIDELKPSEMQNSAIRLTESFLHA
ncbi:MAG: tRNA (adenosine(37)-N6)-dimethylallyltransferase MiaA [Candidatus Obscuribacterales bacterium]|nr:tRNA (adenosine(37)-N6)-dimethylallyltransferase MiaA [Candidatus Obscuribacterales bacterium]